LDLADTASAKKAVELAHDLQPDIVVLDIHLPDGNGLALVKEVHQACPQSRLIVYSLHDYANYMNLLSMTGVSKFIPKLAPLEDLIQAIRFP
jgi:DNA-binding NarL/FixJ family response regulator